MKQRTTNGDAARMARATASDMANLQRAMRAAQDSMAGLNRAIKAPTIKTRRHMIKGSTSTSFLTTLASYFAFSTTTTGGDDGMSYSDSGLSYNSAKDSSTSPGSFYQSSSQTSSNFTFSMKLGQRNL